MTGSRDDFAAVPILLELVPEQDAPVAAEQSPATAPSARRGPGAGAPPVPGREAQQSLFDDVPSPPAQPARADRRPKASPTLHRLAGEMLRAKAPAIIAELAEEHAGRLAGELRERLRRELAGLLAELAAQDPATATDAQVPESRGPAPSGGGEIPGH